jgi:hypothetical protein
MVFEEVESEQHAFGVFGGREVAMATADDNVVDVWNPGCIESLLEFDRLDRIDGMVAVAVDDEGGRKSGMDISHGGHLAGAGEHGSCGFGPARGLATWRLDGSGVIEVSRG